MTQDGYAAGTNRTEQGDAVTRIAGQLDIVTTEGGAGPTLDGVPITPGSALSGVTASAAEVNLNDGAIAGTSVASKTLALGANKNTDVLALPVGGLAIGAGAGTAVTATAAEINTLSSSGVTNADLVKLHAITASAADLNATTDQDMDAEFVVGVEALHVIITTVQLEDADDANLGAAINVDCWLSDAAGGIGTTVDPTSNTAIGGAGAVLTETGGLTHFTKLKVTTGATGAFTVTTAQTAAQSYYLNVRLPNGQIKSSAVIAHAG